MKSVLLLIVLLLAACSGNGSPTQTTPTTEPTKVTTTKPATEFEVIAKNLKTPWAINFNGEQIYISERVGTIAKIEGEKLTRQQVKLSKVVKQGGEGGFLGFVLAPDFATTKQAYAYHTYEEAGKILNRVVLIQENPEGWEEVKVYLEGIPGSMNHNGGRLAIGPDHNLYITTGDSTVDVLAQELKSLGGKILRMTLDGKIPQDNPFADSYVYSYGHRNSQGIAWDSQGNMYGSEHGPSGSPGGHDEINRIEPGKNYGWPLIIGDEKKEGLINPLYHTGETAIAPSGVSFTADDQLLMATLRGQKLFSYDPKSNKLQMILENQGRLRDVKIHNGKTYIITNNTDGRGTPKADDDRLLMLN
ncbi:quinoprotein glucose dehydrogenase [Paenibacillus psychroresistens]|uniref:Quinoprotein glucose dehydrogenase n=1 Tax=Paenibacillus psychroresistens TaxID=1778678 RepID=A0A6B8RLE3_9BACL|nr:PQQ-dependent sugar dehydrogenase [Paenibacillus psychroresistens]QGQ96363.1 quinoprotein glucose dehydrogenase [Paenibacillus psychroresistens]